MLSINDFSASFERFVECARIAVVFGGDKRKENSVINPVVNNRSWKSYELVANDIKTVLSDLGFKSLYIFADDMNFIDNLVKHKINFVWLNTGGVQGRNSICHAASMLEMLGIPYVGHAPEDSVILDSKNLFKDIIRSFNIPTAPSLIWSPRLLDIDLFIESAKVKFSETNQFIVKPVSGRASLNVYYCNGFSEMKKLCLEVNAVTSDLVLVEKYLSGDEYVVGVKGRVIHRNNQFELLDKPFSFSKLKRNLAPDEKVFTSMDIKPITRKRVELVENYQISNTLSKISQDVFSNLNLGSLVRLDLRADDQGKIYVLEANPKPDLKKPSDDLISLISVGLEKEGMVYEDLIKSMLGGSLYGYINYRKNYLGEIYGFLHCKT